MEGRRCTRRRPRRLPHAAPSAGDTTLLHSRLRDAKPLELQAHVSRVVCCAVVVGIIAPPRHRREGAVASQQRMCIVSGDVVGNLSIFYLSVHEVCTKTQSPDERDAAQRLRIRPDVRFRGAHRGSINFIYRIKNSSMLLTGGDDGAVRLWDIQEEATTEGKLRCVQELLFHSSCVVACDVDQSQTFIATAGLDSVVALWLPGVPIPVLTISVGMPCLAVSIVSQDPTLLQVTHIDRVSVWDVRTQPHYVHFQRALLARVRERLAEAPTSDREMHLKSLQQSFSGAESLSWFHDRQVTEAPLSSIHAIGVLTSSTSTPIYDEYSRRFVHPFTAHHSTAQLLRAQPMHRGIAVLTSGTDHAHKLWNAQTRQGIASFEPPRHGGTSSADDQASRSLVAAGLVCRQERFLYGADAIGNIHVWDLRRSITSFSHNADAVAHPVHCLRGHSFFVTSLALSHDDTVLVTGDASGKLHVRVAL